MRLDQIKSAGYSSATRNLKDGSITIDFKEDGVNPILTLEEAMADDWSGVHAQRDLELRLRKINKICQDQGLGMGCSQAWADVDNLSSLD